MTSLPTVTWPPTPPSWLPVFFLPLINGRVGAPPSLSLWILCFGIYAFDDDWRIFVFLLHGKVASIKTKLSFIELYLVLILKKINTHNFFKNYPYVFGKEVWNQPYKVLTSIQFIFNIYNLSFVQFHFSVSCIVLFNF